MQAIYDVATDKITVTGNQNQGQERVWRVVMRLQCSNGDRVKRTVAAKQKCRLPEIVEICRDQMLIEVLEDEGVQMLGFEAYAR